MIAGGAIARAACLALLSSSLAGAVAAAPSPAVHDAEPAIAAARTRALHDGKRLLIVIGADWCANCRVLDTRMRAPAAARFLATHYERVDVDVGRFDRNMAVPRRLGFAGRRLFVPALVVIDPRARHIVNSGDEMVLAAPGAASPGHLMAALARWSR